MAGLSRRPLPLLPLVRAGASPPPPAAQRRRGLPSPALRPLSSPPRASARKRGDDDDDGDGDGGGQAAASSLSDLAAAVTRTWFFRGPLQGAVALVVLAAVDAAYSGDWSRIGAISGETEEALRSLVVALGGFHLVCAAVAGLAASRKGNSVPKAVAKAALVGFLAATEAVFAAEGE